MYTISDATSGCPVSERQVLTVLFAPTVTLVSGDATSNCDTSPLVYSATPAGGTWSGAADEFGVVDVSCCALRFGRWRGLHDECGEWRYLFWRWSLVTACPAAFCWTPVPISNCAWTKTHWRCSWKGECRDRRARVSMRWQPARHPRQPGSSNR